MIMEWGCWSSFYNSLSVEQYAALFQRVAMIMGLSGVKWGQRSEADGLKYTVVDSNSWRIGIKKCDGFISQYSSDHWIVSWMELRNLWNSWTSSKKWVHSRNVSSAFYAQSHVRPHLGRFYFGFNLVLKYYICCSARMLLSGAPTGRTECLRIS